MIALSSLALMTMLLPPPAARAGSWTYVITGDNNGSHSTDNGSPDAPTPYSPAASGTGSDITIPGYLMQRSGNGPSGVGCSMTATVNVQVTFTWHADASLPSDPPPPNVLVLETAGASWVANAGDAQHPGTFTGSATNGLGDHEALSQSSQYSETGVSQSFANYDQNNLKGEHLTSYPASGGTVTIPKRTLTATATTTYPANGQWYYGASVGVSYSGKIHPQPYNFHRVNAYGGPPPTSSVLVGAGDLHFHYEWDSTSGYLAADASHPDLAAIEIHENVDAPSSPTSIDANGVLVYETDTPPFFWNPPVHFDAVILMASAPAIDDHNSWGAKEGTSLSSSFQPPYKADSFDETQTFKFYDPATMTAGTEQIIPGNAGPFTIKEAVIADSNSPSGYSYQVTKDSQPSQPIALP